MNKIKQHFFLTARGKEISIKHISKTIKLIVLEIIHEIMENSFLTAQTSIKLHKRVKKSEKRQIYSDLI